MAFPNTYNRVAGGGLADHGQNTIVHYYDKAGIKAANAISVYSQFADRRSMPLKMGMTYKVSKWLHIFDRESSFDVADNADFNANGYLSSRSFADVTTGLDDSKIDEGTGPANQRAIKKVTIETNFARYGEMIDYTDEVEMFSEDMVQVHYREELGLLANRRSEDLVQLDMLSTTNVMYSGAASSLATVGDLAVADGSTDDLCRVSYDLIRRGVRRLVRNRAEKNTSIVTGSTKIDTRVINKAFYAVIGPEVKYDLEGITRGSTYTTEFAYIPAYKYADATNIAEGEVGAMNDVRFIEAESAVNYAGSGNAIPGSYTGDLSNDGTNFDVFPILFPTKGSFATVGLKGHGKIKFNAQSPGKIELDNPYGTKGFFSYNMWYAGLILREERLLKILVCASM